MKINGRMYGERRLRIRVKIMILINQKEIERDTYCMFCYAFMCL